MIAKYMIQDFKNPIKNLLFVEIALKIMIVWSTLQINEYLSKINLKN